MGIHRRDFFKETAFGAALLAALGLRSRAEASPEAPRASRFKIGACDWSLGKGGSPEAFAAAQDSWIEGVEVSLGCEGEKLRLSDSERQKRFLEAARKEGLAIPSTCLEILHRDGLKDHPRGPKWVEEAIEPTKALGAKVILLPMFGGKAIEERSEQKAVAERLKPIASSAEKAGVVLGLENTISAEDNAWIIDQVGSSAVKVYYDVGNSHPRFDVYKEVPWLGKDRICQIHLKDGSARLLGKGKIDIPRFLESVLASKFEGWLVLETSPQPMKEDAAYVKGLISDRA